MATDLVPWQHFLVYAIKGEGDATHKIQHDTGRESQAYLRFIYDYYDCLPQVSPCCCSTPMKDRHLVHSKSWLAQAIVSVD